MWPLGHRHATARRGPLKTIEIECARCVLSTQHAPKGLIDRVHIGVCTLLATSGQSSVLRVSGGSPKSQSEHASWLVLVKALTYRVGQSFWASLPMSMMISRSSIPLSRLSRVCETTQHVRTPHSDSHECVSACRFSDQYIAVDIVHVRHNEGVFTCVFGYRKTELPPTQTLRGAVCVGKSSSGRGCSCSSSCNMSPINNHIPYSNHRL